MSNIVCFVLGNRATFTLNPAEGRGRIIHASIRQEGGTIALCFHVGAITWENEGISGRDIIEAFQRRRTDGSVGPVQIRTRIGEAPLSLSSRSSGYNGFRSTEETRRNGSPRKG